MCFLTMAGYTCHYVYHTLIARLVGGEILDLALARAKPHSRFVVCGAISEYNRTNRQGLKVINCHTLVMV